MVGGASCAGCGSRRGNRPPPRCRPTVSAIANALVVALVETDDIVWIPATAPICDIICCAASPTPRSGASMSFAATVTSDGTDTPCESPPMARLTNIDASDSCRDASTNPIIDSTSSVEPAEGAAALTDRTAHVARDRCGDRERQRSHGHRERRLADRESEDPLHEDRRDDVPAHVAEVRQRLRGDRRTEVPPPHQGERDQRRRRDVARPNTNAAAAGRRSRPG